MSCVTILGAGAWGTAVAIYLASQGHDIRLWCRDPQQALNMQKIGTNQRYLPDFVLPQNVQVSADLEYCVTGADFVLIAVPSSAWILMLNQLRALCNLAASQYVGWLTKGLTDDVEQPFLHQSAHSLLPLKNKGAMLSGPSFANEVAMGYPTGLCVTSEDPICRKAWQTLFASKVLRIYGSDDWVGVQCCAAMKNILAVASGVVEGLGFGANTHSMLITRGLAEIARLVQTLGGQVETCLGLAGVGDIVLTCTDNQSRNRRLGYYLGQGLSIDQAKEKIGAAIESLDNVKRVKALCDHQQIRMPILNQVYALLIDGIGAQDACDALLSAVQ